VYCAGFIVKENCPYPSNWRNSLSFSDYLQKNGVVGLEGIDTRKLVRHIREKGAMRGIISSESLDLAELKNKLDTYPGLEGRDIVKDVTLGKSYPWDKGVVDVISGQENLPAVKHKVVAIDYGIKHNILRLLRSHGCQVQVVRASATAKEILAHKPDGVFLSNGPGDPAAVTYAVETIRQLLGRSRSSASAWAISSCRWPWAARPTS
jgi:carbamoyl-phosphate synthase small subunit